ncbi:Gfo/Idh/MocA family oxidoreductase, partial [Pantoea sp. SIMBA_072]
MTYIEHRVAEELPVRVGLIGAGWIGNFHAESLVRRVPGAQLEAIADPALSAVEALASRLGITKITTDAADVLNDP